ncbi:MAG: hypothetical protein RLY31_701 [Bacteroidota bacterium]|jgi:16S rRNA (cytosine967-C5)-methyltransferase
MKIHPPLVSAVLDTLLEIFQGGRYADKAVAQVLRSNPRWGSRDRAFIAENVYEVVRWRRRLQALLTDGEAPDGLLPVDRNLAAALLGVNLAVKGWELPPWPMFRGWNQDGLPARNATAPEHWPLRIRESVPDWLDELGTAELGQDWERLLPALNRPAPLVLRTNVRRIRPPELADRLRELGWDASPHPLSPAALVLHRQGNIFQTTLFKQGLFEVQDAGSQCIAPFLEVEPGMRVVDACAGAGGKSLHLADLMQDKGSIISLDVEAHKLATLKERARRNGVSIVQTRIIDSTKTIKRLKGSADRLLLDVPCSGLGVLRRNPDAKWKLSPDFLDAVRRTQADILDRYSTMLAPGGSMVYATCSILPSENERQVEAFLATHGEFECRRTRHLNPLDDHCDGFFMALLRRR